MHSAVRCVPIACLACVSVCRCMCLCACVFAGGGEGRDGCRGEENIQDTQTRTHRHTKRFCWKTANPIQVCDACRHVQCLGECHDLEVLAVNAKGVNSSRAKLCHSLTPFQEGQEIVRIGLRTNGRQVSKRVGIVACKHAM